MELITIEEKNHILSMVPAEILPLIQNVSNVLDQGEVIFNLLKDKDIRAVFGFETDKFKNKKIVGLYHVADLCEKLECDYKNIHRKFTTISDGIFKYSNLCSSFFEEQTNNFFVSEGSESK